MVRLLERSHIYTIRLCWIPTKTSGSDPVRIYRCLHICLNVEVPRKPGLTLPELETAIGGCTGARDAAYRTRRAIARFVFDLG
jgi:hypothetical protein